MLVAQATTLLIYYAPLASSLPELFEDPAWQSVSSQNIINSLSATLAGPIIQRYQSNGSNNGLGNLLTGAGTTMDMGATLSCGSSGGVKLVR